MKSTAIWDRHAVQWDEVGPPLRPCRQDIDLLQRFVADHCAGRNGALPRAILLGVTPEIARMRWPAGTRLLALDFNRGMIGNLWPDRPASRASALCGDWTRMPIGNETCDVAASDCCYSSLRYPEGYTALTRELRRVLRSDGVFALRSFLRPSAPEPLEAVFADLRAGRIGNFHVFKWRLAMALHADLTAGVRLADIWDAWHEACPDPAALARTLGWPLSALRTIDAYRGLATCYTFPTAEELRAVLSAHFSETACVYATYELGERCPTFLFVPR